MTAEQQAADEIVRQLKNIFPDADSILILRKNGSAFIEVFGSRPQNELLTMLADIGGQLNINRRKENGQH